MPKLEAKAKTPRAKKAGAVKKAAPAKAADPGPATRTCGFCDTAKRVEAGTIQSTTTPKGWHDMCRGGRCACGCSEGKAQCAECGGRIPPEEGTECADTKECQARQRRQEEAARRSKEMAQMREQIRKERSKAALDENGQPKPPRPKAEPKLPGRCEHCGDTTKGGRFVAGHDAKLKGILIKEARGGKGKAAVEACAEILVRNWPCKDVDAGVMEKAQAIIDGDPGWLQARVIKRIGKGEG